MKRLLISVFVCMMSAMPAFSAVISDNFCSNSIGTICLSVNDVRDWADLNGSGNSKSDNVIQTITSCLAERSGLSLDKDFEHIGTFIIPNNSRGISYIGFVTGDFNSKKKAQAIGNFVLSLSEEAKLEKIQKKDGVVPTFAANGYRLMFLNANVILFGNDDDIKKVINGDITFGKAPGLVTKLLSNSDSFMHFNELALALLGQFPQVPSEIVALLNGCNNASVYIKDLMLSFDLAFSNSENAGNIKSLADETKKKYLELNEKSLSDANDKLKQVSIKDFFDEARNLHFISKTLDNLEQITISQENNFIHITAPTDRTQLAIGAIGVVVEATANPELQKAKKHAKADACYANIKILLAAVEMYNMDNSVKMTELDIQKLVDGKYLKNEPSKPELGCSYFSEGDITKDGLIKCRIHGNLNARLKEARKNACYSNIRVMLGAVEMYNMDNSVMMTELDIQKLVDGKYLKNEPSKPDPDCSYYSEGDITKDGLIKCRKHGNP